MVCDGSVHMPGVSLHTPYNAVKLEYEARLQYFIEQVTFYTSFEANPLTLFLTCIPLKECIICTIITSILKKKLITKTLYKIQQNLHLNQYLNAVATN